MRENGEPEGSDLERDQKTTVLGAGTGERQTISMLINMVKILKVQSSMKVSRRINCSVNQAGSRPPVGYGVNEKASETVMTKVRKSIWRRENRSVTSLVGKRQSHLTKIQS